MGGNTFLLIQLHFQVNYSGLQTVLKHKNGSFVRICVTDRIISNARCGSHAKLHFEGMLSHIGWIAYQKS